MTERNITVKHYLKTLPEDRQQVVADIRKTIADNIPKGFAENIKNNMINYTIPLSIYPDGYHCKKDTPLPFISIASQKNFIALYHMGLYADEKLTKWFTTEYPKHCKYKLNMGKSCIRFKYLNDIPHTLLAELTTKITVNDFIKTYETVIKK